MVRYRYPQQTSCLFPRCLQYVLKTCLQDVFKTCLQRNNFSSSSLSSGHLERCLQDVFKTSWKMKNCYAANVLKTSSRHVLKKSWPTNVYWAKIGFEEYGSSHRNCSTKKVFLKMSQNSQENTCASVRVSLFNKFAGWHMQLYWNRGSGTGVSFKFVKFKKAPFLQIILWWLIRRILLINHGFREK